MDARRPEIDMDKYYDFHNTEDVTPNEPKDPPAKFCGADCRQSYREDRIQGKTLAPVSMNGQMVSHKVMCDRLKVCAYCLSKLEK